MRKFYSLWLMFFFVLVLRLPEAHAQLIFTKAGNGTYGFSGDEGKAINASLNVPKGLAIDKEGNIYFTDIVNARVRKVSATTGIITTVAGNGASEYSGDGGLATNASLRFPAGVALDGKGNLYIADSFNDRIRKVSLSTGIITTVVGNGSHGTSGDGGLATDASLNFPEDVTLDNNGNLYIDGGYSVRKIDAATGIITTIAGKGGVRGFSGDSGPATEALMTSPSSISLDGNGNLYIADIGNHRIRKVEATTGIISTVVGNGTAGFTGDGGLATSASLNNPSEVTMDENGNLYISDDANHRIRRVDASTGIITTIAGNGAAGFAGDGGRATDASLYFPKGLAMDSNGNLYIADLSNSRIRYICKTSSLVSGSNVGVRTIEAGQNVTAAFEDNCSVHLKLQPSGVNPVAGTVIDSVWIEPSVPTTAGGQPYVQRHYGITPSLNGSTATAILTLYYTQADFTAYNAVPNHGPDLPIDAIDAANNKANVRIYKRSGTSNNGTGLFDTYSGTTTGIVPTSVVWDSHLNAWAVTFDVVGFSGFFLASASLAPLPLTLVDFSARLQATDGVLNWRTAAEQGVAAFEVERSQDTRNFLNRGSISATNANTGNSYTFIDKNIAALGSAVLYYRLKIVDKDGSFRLSRVVPVNIIKKEAVVMLFPNPVEETTNLQVESEKRETLRYSILDATGRTIITRNINVVEGSNVFTIETSSLSTGTYTLLLKGTKTSKQLKFVKN